MGTGPRLDSPALDTVLNSLLTQNPGSLVVAISDKGLFVPMPASVPMEGHQEITGSRSMLELVLHTDIQPLIETWDKAVADGSAYTSVHLLSDPGHASQLYFVDGRHSHGVYIGVLLGARGTVGESGQATEIRPRLSVARKDERAVVLEAEEEIRSILGWEPEELVGHRTLDLLHPDDHSRAIANWMDMLGTPGCSRRVRLRHRHRDGSWVWLEVTNRNLLDTPGYGYVLAEMVDISDEMKALEDLRANEQLLSRLTEALPLGVLQLDHGGNVVYRNARADELLEPPAERSLTSLLGMIESGDSHRLEQAVAATLRHGLDTDLEVAMPRHRRRYSVRLRALATPSGEVTGALMCLADVTEEARLKAELRDRATYDALTRCRNRPSILSALGQALSDAAHDSEHGSADGGTGVVFLDLDGFKGINDRYGHRAGDRLLEVSGHRLLHALRGHDLAGRLGGDEFLVVCRDLADQTDLDELGRRLAKSLSRDVRLDDGTVLHPRCSHGVGWTAAGALGADELVARADAAMYADKRRRRVVGVGA